jgi:heme exporter protein A
MSPAPPIHLRAEGLTLHRAGRPVIKEHSFTVSAGELLILTGPNGAGKSSLLRALIGLTPLSAGRLMLHDAATVITPRDLCPLVLYQGHASGLKGALSPMENLALSATLDGLLTPNPPAQETACAQALQRLGLGQHLARESRHLSQGQRQRLQLARYALARQTHAKPLWLMDEPSSALDQAGTEVLHRLLREHLAAGGAAIVATHQPITPVGVTPRELRLGSAFSSCS